MLIPIVKKIDFYFLIKYIKAYIKHVPQDNKMVL